MFFERQTRSPKSDAFFDGRGHYAAKANAWAAGALKPWWFLLKGVLRTTVLHERSRCGVVPIFGLVC